MDSLGNSQTQKVIYYMIPMLQKFLNDKMIEAGNRLEISIGFFKDGKRDTEEGGL